MMVHTLLKIVFFACCLATGYHSQAQTREEFNGPMATWCNVKKQFNARGNGKDDDTKAIQQAIDNLSNPAMNYNMGPGAYMVVYLPAGTYCISSTLMLRGKIGVSIIGEDPRNTVIKWIGTPADTMLWADGSGYFKIARIAWDGNGRKNMECIGIHWKSVWSDGKTKSFASLNIEIADNYFRNCVWGISGGTSGEGTNMNDSEITIRRCLFDGCLDAGISVRGYNALDYWIWDCRFIKCAIGVKNTAGNYHVYRSYFSGTGFSDLRNFNGYYTSARGCYSENAYAFSLDDGVSCNPFKRIFQDNTVLQLKNYPIEFYHLGKVTLWGNRFSKVRDSTRNYMVNNNSWCPGIYEIMSLNNTYEVKEPFRIAPSAKKYSIADRFQTPVKAMAAPFLSSMDPLPAYKKRPVFEVKPGSDARAIQSIIDKAAALKGQRPIVHFGVGKHYIDRTLVIPANSDMQIVGDGLLYASVIAAAPNLAGSPLMLVKGPSYVVIKDLQIGDEGGRPATAAIVLTNVDQSSASARIDQLYSLADTSLVSDGMDYLQVEKNNSFFSSGNYISGGPLSRQGKGKSQVVCYGGQFAKLSVQNGGKFIAKDCWWEGNTRVPLDLKGSGDICIDGAMIAPVGVDSNITIRVREFNGRISLMNMYLQGALAVEPGNAALDLLAWNVHFYHVMNLFQHAKSGPNARQVWLGLSAQCFNTKNKNCENIVSVEGRTDHVRDTTGFIEKLTSFDRNTGLTRFVDLPAGVSNIFISRVSVGNLPRGIVFTNR